MVTRSTKPADPIMVQALDAAYEHVKADVDFIDTFMTQHRTDGAISVLLGGKVVQIIRQEQVDEMRRWMEINYTQLRVDIEAAPTMQAQQEAIMNMMGANFRLYELKGMVPNAYDESLLFADYIEDEYKKLVATDERPYSKHVTHPDFMDTERYLGIIGRARVTIAELTRREDLQRELVNPKYWRTTFADLALDHIMAGKDDRDEMAHMDQDEIEEAKKTGIASEALSERIQEHAERLMHALMEPYCANYEHMTPEIAGLIGKTSLRPSDVRRPFHIGDEDFKKEHVPLFAPDLQDDECKERVRSRLPTVLARYVVNASEPHSFLNAEEALGRSLGDGPGAGTGGGGRARGGRGGSTSKKAA